jgi:signal recognition particle subunit SRP19
LPSKKSKTVILYPEYFTIDNSRKAGRRVPKKMALKSTSVEDISKAIKSLGLKPVVEKEKAYPRFWWKKRGRVLIETEMQKTELIKLVAEKLRKKSS